MKINPFPKINYNFGIFPEVCHFHARSSEKILNALQQFTSQTSFQEWRWKWESHKVILCEFPICLFIIIYIAICLSVLLQEARLKELDEEHDLLQSGLQVIEKARKWYFKRITAIQEEKLHLQNQDQYSLEQVKRPSNIHVVV